MMKRLEFDLKMEGYLTGVMLKNDILAVRLKDQNCKVKFYFYDINMKGSDSSWHSPINAIYRGKEERGNQQNVHHFRINNFSIIENIEDSFVFTDFC